MEAAKTDGNLAYAQRLGWMMEKTGHSEHVAVLSRWVADQNPIPARLEPSQPVKGAKKDNRWRILINTDVKDNI